MATNVHEVVDLVKDLKLSEVRHLVDALEEALGVSAESWIHPLPPQPGPEPEPERVQVILSEVGDQRLAVVKALRTALGLGLREASGLTKQLPSVLQTEVGPDDAARLVATLEEAGATLQVRPVP